ncbi:E3 ubiquitin-protein ligase MBR1 [Cardamine amara subsp. amara]|uniref:RING-type E3 ubiquitin transferase n=1 Tax=Cardamine amara subsp. amara TaxID=228776 RepID=A0ABD1B0V6_CARAN
MDGFKGKRTSKPIMPRKGSGLVLHENMKKKEDKSIVPICSRIGCSSRINSTKEALIDHKTKSSFRSPLNGKETVASSSRSVGIKKVSKVIGRRQLSSLLDMDSSESSSVNEDSATAFSRGKNKESTISVHSDNSVSGEVVTEAGSSSRGSGRSISQRPDLVTRDARVGNSVQNVRANVNKNGLRDLRSKSGSDVLPPNANPTVKRNIFRKKNSDGESSSSNRGNKTGRSVIEVRNQSSLQGNGITMSESRRNRNLPNVRDNSVVSSSTRRSSGGYYGRTGRAGAVASIQAPQPETRADLNPTRSAEVSRSPSNSYSRPISSNGRLRSLMIPGSPSESGLSRSLLNRDSFRRYNMNGVAEVLLALERIEQDEELTYEQLVVLETNLFLNGMSSFHDQHRDMRLDIDNMSYEELLALEEKMGTVSTALSEEALLKSLKSSIYHPNDESGDICLNKDNDVKCSICQEEYIDGDEVGTLPCQHMYHVSCAQQWLRMKNWCPICKTSAESQPQPFS